MPYLVAYDASDVKIILSTTKMSSLYLHYRFNIIPMSEAKRVRYTVDLSTNLVQAFCPPVIGIHRICTVIMYVISHTK